jgi:hypothetical protein
VSTSNEDLRLLIESVSSDVQRLNDRVGHESEDGKSGTGLFGEVRRMGEEVRQITGLKHKGLGLVAAGIVFLAVVVLGAKNALVALMGVATGSTSAIWWSSA